MLHASPQPDSQPTSPPGTEAAARMASIRQALRAADLIAGKTSAEAGRPTDITQIWPELGEPARRCFAARSERVANTALGGMEALLAKPVHHAAAERLSDELRAGIARIETLFDPR